MKENIYIVAAKRTAIGSFQGSLSQIPAARLGASSIKAAIHQSGLSEDLVNECIMGNVLTAGVGQAPARQAALYAGLPNSVPCMTINKVCGSGLKAVMLAADSIQLGHSQVVVAGGQENMSLSPHLLLQSRTGYRMGDVKVKDSMLVDGLWDPYNDYHMGNASEICVKEYKFSREELDAFATESYKRSQSSQATGLFKDEITPVEVKTRKETLLVDTDEEPKKVIFDKIAGLRPAFDKDGSITAANASTINDGGCALVLVNEKTLKDHNLSPLAKIVNYTSHAQEPQWFTTAPVAAMKKSLELNKMSAKDIDLFEVNEAFSNVTMAAMRDLNIPHDKMNVNGGAVSLGHPIGASGARILTTLLYALKNKNKSTGMASICIGGGEAVAVLVERV
ncbi:MAG: thiolase family protein [Bdellovibrionales bacterium]|nr:thiolase family protein [Bdellovibrionales bacterium]